MTEWTVELEVAARSLPDSPELDDRFGELIDALRINGAAGRFRADRYYVQLSLEAPSLVGGLERGKDLVARAAEAAGLPFQSVVGITVRDVNRSKGDEPLAFPTLVGIAETAGLLGVSKQRASEVAHLSAFPRPVATLASGPVWLRSSVVAFAEHWARKPGRPRLASA